MADISIIIPNGFREEMRQYGNKIAKNIAIMARDELSAEYARSVDDLFYSAYTPRKYNRKYQLQNSFSKYYRNPHGNIVSGGVEISASRMGDVYHDSPSEVLDLALIGYHGRPRLGIVTSPSLIEHILKFRDLLYASIDSYAGTAIGAAQGGGKYF